MSFTLNRRPAVEPPVESVTLTLDMQQLAALDVVTSTGIAGSHPLRGLVWDVVDALPSDQRTAIRTMTRAFPSPSKYPDGDYGRELLA